MTPTEEDILARLVNEVGEFVELMSVLQGENDHAHEILDKYVGKSHWSLAGRIDLLMRCIVLPLLKESGLKKSSDSVLDSWLQKYLKEFE